MKIKKKEEEILEGILKLIVFLLSGLIAERYYQKNHLEQKQKYVNTILRIVIYSSFTFFLRLCIGQYSGVGQSSISYIWGTSQSYLKYILFSYISGLIMGNVSLLDKCGLGKIRKIQYKDKFIMFKYVLICLVSVFFIFCVCIVIIQNTVEENIKQYNISELESTINSLEETSEQKYIDVEESVVELENEIETLKLTLSDYLGFYEKLNNALDVNILIIGDSIGSGTDENSWAGQLELFLEEEYGGEVLLTNISMGGNTSYAGYVRTMVLNDEIEYDLAIVCYGQNDSLENFSMYYESIYRAINSKYEQCSIISILESSQREYTEKIEVIQELANHYNVDVADTIAAFSESDYEYDELSDDGVHPNTFGKTVYFETIQKIIETNIENDMTTSLEEIPIVNDGVVNLDYFQFLDVSEFERIDEYSYEIEIDAFEGILGIYYTVISGENSVDIYMDDELFVTKAVLFDYDFSQYKIHIISEDVMIEKKIKLVFHTEEQADQFKGIALSTNM